MALISQIESSLEKASSWLVSSRGEKGAWADMVYKRQGILNTAEAWLSLVEVRSVLKDVPWEKRWIEEDCKRLAQEVEAHGFLRSPYCPEDQPHESIDAAAFVLLMLDALFNRGRDELPQPMLKLVESAVDFLIENQSPSGGWSWGLWKKGRPRYPYFTHMAISSLQSADEKKAVGKGMNWFISAQLSDGSFSVHSESREPDLASTAYAVMALSQIKRPKAQTALRRAIGSLLEASFSDITQVGHLKIVEPDKPPQRQVDYENYSVAANVLLALIAGRPSMKGVPQLDDRIQFLVQHLLDQQASHGGWPGSYSTIYTTHTSVSALVAYLKSMPRQTPSKTIGSSGHFNPYVFGFPIQHPQAFFGRKSIIERIRADMDTPPEMKRDLALIGQRRIGKTSLLYQLPFHFQQDGHQVFYLDLELMQSTRQFLQTFLVKLGEAVFRAKSGASMKTLFLRAMENLDRKPLSELDLELQLPFLKLSTTQTEELFTAFLADVGRLMERFSKWRKSPRAKVVCLLDEIAYLQNFGESSIISLLRGIAQGRADLVFIVAGTPKALDIITSEASPFYNIFTPIHIGQLETDAAMALITAPVEGKINYTAEAVGMLLQASQRNPYTLQALCYHCVRLLPSSDKQVDETLVRSAILTWQNQKEWK